MSDAKRDLRLVLLGEKDTWAALPARDTLVIGSSPDRAGFVIPGQGVDAVHCAVGKAKGGGWVIKDLGSQYGTLVNGEPITSVRLWTGDLIVLGSRRLRVVDPELPLAAETAAPSTEAALEEIELEHTAAPPGEPRPTSGGGNPPQERPASAGGAPAAGQRHLGGFRLEKMLGRGGMGSVHLAVQESLNRPVALKVLSPRLAADRDFVRRFQTEARAAAALSHPNVVVVHDVGEADGHHYLAMEFMPGGTLEDRVAASGPLPWRQVLDILHDAAAGLVFAEETGIVHRDIKPANLMLTGTGTVKIADLGLATNVEAEATQSEGKKIFGTPHFISPEQARGESVDHRSDLYSLGATAYRLLTGHTPFEGDTTRDILRGHFTQDPAPLTDHVPEIPAGLNDIVARLLAKDPAERPPSAAVLLREVDRLRLEADGESAPEVTIRRRRIPVAGLLVVVLLGVGAVSAWKILGGSDSNGEIVTPPPPDPDPVDDPPLDDTGFFTDPTDDPGGNDEERLEILDLQAQLAYSKIPASLPTLERIERLRTIATDFVGTETALSVVEEIRTLELRYARTEQEAARLQAALANCEGELRTAAGWPPAEGELPAPGPALTGLLRYVPPDGVGELPGFAALRDALVAEIVAHTRTAFATELADGQKLADAGKFDDLRARLDTLTARLQLPDYPEGTEPPGLGDLRTLAVEVSAWRGRVDGQERAWQLARAEGDRSRLASGIGRESGLAALLGDLALEDAATRLLSLSETLVTPQARTRAEDLATALVWGHEALMSLVNEFGTGGWRRNTISDPRGARSVARDALGTRVDGILVDVNGEAELVPWSAFGGRLETIEMLFKGRFERAYTAQEQRGILVLLHLGATLETMRLADQVLAPSSRSILLPSEAEEMTALFDRALAWGDTIAGEDRATTQPLLDELATAREAAVILARGLLAAQDGAWSTTVGELETLFSDYQSTLLVTLLSDGSGWEETAREEPPPGPGEDPKPLDGPTTPDDPPPSEDG